MSNRRKSKEEKLLKMANSSKNYKKQRQAQEELSRIELYKQAAALEGLKVKETGHGR